MAIEITILNGVDVLAQAFNAVAAFVNNQTWFSLLAIAEFLGIFAAAIAYVKSQDIKGMFLWLLTFVLINALLLTPKERVVITDLANPTTFKQVNNVPIGVAYPLYMVTNIGNSIARTYDTFFSQPEDIQYSKTGLLFGQRLLEESFYLAPSDSELDANLNNYIKSCVIERQLINPTTWRNLKGSKELIQTLYQGKESDYVSYKSGSATSFQKCSVAGRSIAQAINQVSSGTSYIQRIMRGLGLSTSGTTNLPQFKDKLSTVQGYFMGSSKSASEIYTQNMLVNAYRRAFDNYPVSLDNSADLIAQASEQSLTKMKLAHLSSYNVAGRMLPALHTVLLVLMVSIFPIMVLAMFVREFTVGVVKNYFAVLCSLMMWPVLFAVFNSIINTLTYQTLNGEAFTLSTMDTMKENAASIAGVASWLMLSIPFISFKLTTNLGQNIASAGSYLGNSLAGATSADAGQVAAGNYAWGNMQMHNINGNKVDLNSVFKVGHSTTQLDNGAMKTVTADGATVLDSSSAISRLPMGLNLGKAFDTALSSARQFVSRQSETFSEGYRDATTKAHDAATSLLNNYTHQELRGKGLSEGDIRSIESVARETVDANRNLSGTDSTKYGNETNTTYTNTANANLNGGASVGKDGYGIAAKAGADANVGYSINDSNTERASKDTTTNRGKSSSHNWSNGESASKIANFSETHISNINDSHVRSLVQNIQDSVRTAQENFSGFTAAKSREQQLSVTASMTESNRIGVEHNLQQEFANFVRGKIGEQADYILTDGSANARLERERLVAEYSEELKNTLQDIYSNNTNRVLGEWKSHPVGNIQRDSGFASNTNSLEEQARGLGIQTNLKQLDPSSERNLDTRMAYAKQSGKNTANINWAEDDSANMEKRNNAKFEEKK